MNIMKEPMLEIISEALSNPPLFFFWWEEISVGRNALRKDWEFQIIRP